MKYLDITMNCSKNGILLDEYFNSDELNWSGGDYFQLVNINGRQWLIKIDPLIKMIKDEQSQINSESTVVHSLTL